MKISNIKKFGVTLALGGIMLVTACSNKGPEGVVATVNDTNIPEEKFITQYVAQRNNTVMMAGSEDILKEPSVDNPSVTVDEALKENTLKNLVEMEIVRQDAEKLGVKVDEAKVEEQVKSAVDQVGGEEEYKEQLKKIGATPEFYKDYLRQAQLMSEYYEKKIKEFEPSEKDLKDYYEKNKENYFKAKASHILLEDVEKANKLKKELDKGADFAELAKENSKDPGSAQNGGDLGEFTNGQMVQEFNEAIKVMKKGEISDPIKSDFGYHIIKLTEKTPRTFEEMKDSLKETYIKEKFGEYIEKLKKDAKVKEYLDVKKEIEIPENLKLEIPENNKTEKDNSNTNTGNTNTKSNNKQGNESK